MNTHPDVGQGRPPDVCPACERSFGLALGAPDVSLAATPDYTTRAETAAGDLRNAAQILDAALMHLAGVEDAYVAEARKDLVAVARLLRAALSKLEAK